jgi:hypothetical protein
MHYDERWLWRLSPVFSGTTLVTNDTSQLVLELTLSIGETEAFNRSCPGDGPSDD